MYVVQVVRDEEKFMMLHLSLHVLIGIYFIVAEADRIVAVRSHIEADQLTCDFTGQLRNALSSSDADKQAILEE